MKAKPETKDVGAIVVQQVREIQEKVDRLIAQRAGDTQAPPALASSGKS